MSIDDHGNKSYGLLQYGKHRLCLQVLRCHQTHSRIQVNVSELFIVYFDDLEWMAGRYFIGTDNRITHLCSVLPIRELLMYFCFLLYNGDPISTPLIGCTAERDCFSSWVSEFALP